VGDSIVSISNWLGLRGLGFIGRLSRSLFVDTFNRSNTTTTQGLGTFSDESNTWVASSASWNINNNRAANNGTEGFAVADFGSADVDVNVKLSDVGRGHGIQFRHVNASNYWRWTSGSVNVTTTIPNTCTFTGVSYGAWSADINGCGTTYSDPLFVTFYDSNGCPTGGIESEFRVWEPLPNGQFCSGQSTPWRRRTYTYTGVSGSAGGSFTSVSQRQYLSKLVNNTETTPFTGAESNLNALRVTTDQSTIRVYTSNDNGATWTLRHTSVDSSHQNATQHGITARGPRTSTVTSGVIDDFTLLVGGA
jgi:hypothetical protein